MVEGGDCPLLPSSCRISIRAESHEGFGSNGRHKCRENEGRYDDGPGSDGVHESPEEELLLQDKDVKEARKK